MINIIGNSHTHVLRTALMRAPDMQSRAKVVPLGSALLLYQPFFREAPEGVAFTVEKFEASLVEGFDTPFITPTPDTAWALSMGFHSARFFGAPMWRRFSPWETATEKHMPLSDAAVSSIVLDEVQHMLAFYKALQAHGINFFIMSAPPPPAHHRSFMDAQNRDTAIKMNCVYRTILASILDELGIAYVLPPPETLSDEGLLCDAYNDRNPEDQHHANNDYGALMLPRVVEFGEKMLQRSLGGFRPAVGSAYP